MNTLFIPLLSRRQILKDEYLSQYYSQTSFRSLPALKHDPVQHIL